MLWGSLSLAQALMKDGLTDEYQLIVCPIVLGNGRPLFPAGTPSLGLELVETQSIAGQYSSPTKVPAAVEGVRLSTGKVASIPNGAVPRPKIDVAIPHVRQRVVDGSHFGGCVLRAVTAE